MALPKRLTVAGLPETYFVPRDGTFSRVTAFDPHQLRNIRTELELLRRIRRRLETYRARPAADLVNRFTQADRDELSRILHDAGHQSVPEMIELFDREFPEIKKDIVMSVVNDESENIVQEAAEAGLINHRPGVDPGAGIAKSSASTTTPDALTATAPLTPRSVRTGLTKALDEVEAAIDETMQLCHEGATAPLPCADSVDAAPGSVPSSESDAVSTSTPASPVVPSTATPPPTVTPARPVELGEPSDRKTEAVRTIERGIRSMADALHDEVAAQWSGAQSLLAEVAASGERASASQTEIESLLVEVRKLRDDARLVADELDQTRRQARVSREDARRAKERAEAGAAAAELAADQASRDALHAGEHAPRS